MSNYVQEENKNMFAGIVIGMFIGTIVGVSVMCLVYCGRN